jgi:hypothetical protein
MSVYRSKFGRHTSDNKNLKFCQYNVSRSLLELNESFSKDFKHMPVNSVKNLKKIGEIFQIFYEKAMQITKVMQTGSDESKIREMSDRIEPKFKKLFYFNIISLYMELFDYDLNVLFQSDLVPLLSIKNNAAILKRNIQQQLRGSEFSVYLKLLFFFFIMCGLTRGLDDTYVRSIIALIQSEMYFFKTSILRSQEMKTEELKEAHTLHNVEKANISTDFLTSLNKLLEEARHNCFPLELSAFPKEKVVVIQNIA